MLELPLIAVTGATTSWSRRGTRVAGPPSLSGRRQISRLDGGGWWEADMTGLMVHSQSSISPALWQAMQVLLDGGISEIIVPHSGHKETAPWPTSGGADVTSYPDVALDDGAYFDDGAGFDHAPIDAELVVGAALRATKLRVRINAGAALVGGEFLTLVGARGPRLHLVGRAVARADGDYDVTIAPPTRAPAGVGAYVDLNHPRCLMQLASIDAADAVFESPFYARPSLRFVEATIR